MPIERLDHVNLRTTQLDTMIDWYTDVIGLRKGDRPDFPFPGAWMYAGDVAVVHLVGAGDECVGSEAELKLEHFAFSATGLADFESMLREKGEKFRRVEVPGTDIVQVNIWDPDGNHIHVDFTADE